MLYFGELFSRKTVEVWRHGEVFCVVVLLQERFEVSILLVFPFTLNKVVLIPELHDLKHIGDCLAFVLDAFFVEIEPEVHGQESFLAHKNVNLFAELIVTDRISFAA